jgi:SAM-dependent methyltransferase
VVRPFAEHYDLVYADKDYDKDIADFSRLVGNLPMERVLEIGAGTGNQSLRLARLVGELVAVEIDPDFSEMLAAKLAGAGVENVHLEKRPLAELPPAHFDAAAAFFHVLNYIDPAAMPEFATALAGRLKVGAAFVADLWNGAAALNDPPRSELRKKNRGDTVVLQGIVPALHAESRRLALDYDVKIDDGGSAIQFHERITLYLWLQEELANLLRGAGFCNITFYDYARFPMQATNESWRIWLHATRN